MRKAKITICAFLFVSFFGLVSCEDALNEIAPDEITFQTGETDDDDDPDGAK